MTEHVLSPKAMLKTIGSSRGAQPKYYEEGIWYKEDLAGYEGEAEYLVSLVLSCSNVKDYVSYQKCSVNGKSGCSCRDFTCSGEIFLSFQRLFDLYNGGEMEGFLSSMSSPKERIQYTVHFIEETTSLDVRDYLSKTLSLDYLILNPDRHMNNLGVIANQDTGEYRLAPVFDNGAALLSDVLRFPYGCDWKEYLEKVPGRPFSSNLGLQALEAGLTLQINYDMLLHKLEKEEDSRAKQVLLYQLQQHEKIYRS